MRWVLWRQHRVQAAIAAALLAAFALPVLITGSSLHTALDTCRASDSCTGALLNGYNNVNTLVDLTILVPAVIGLFWGAVIVGRELENGTVALVWTQTITRRHWLRTKLTTLFLGTVLSSTAVSALVTWWSATRNATSESRFGGLQFDIQGIVPVGYAIFAAALGLASGVVWRRALPAMATTVGGFIGVRLLIELFARPHYMSPIVKEVPLGEGMNMPGGALSIGTDLMHNGRVVTDPIRVPPRCAATTTRTASDACMQHHGYQVRMTYQPAGRYWTFQWIESGIFVGLAALLVAAALLLLRRRDA